MHTGTEQPGLRGQSQVDAQRCEGLHYLATGRAGNPGWQVLGPRVVDRIGEMRRFPIAADADDQRNAPFVVQ
jgi:hypothetical protein